MSKQSIQNLSFVVDGPEDEEFVIVGEGTNDHFATIHQPGPEMSDEDHLYLAYSAAKIPVFLRIQELLCEGDLEGARALAESNAREIDEEIASDFFVEEQS